MKLLPICALILGVPFLTIGQNSSQKSKTLFVLGDTPYAVDEFEYYFLKNSERPSASEAKKMVNDYLDLYVEFRLKVLEARSRGMDQEKAFKEELAGYKDQLIEPYLIASKINDDQIFEAYERMKTDVSGYHILISPPPGYTPEDTVKVYNQLLELKKRALSGEDFGELAFEYSQDRSAKVNRGYLGYFTSMQMVYPFENAAYQGNAGDVVGPFKTRFGYHLLKIKDKRPSRAKVLAAHIMIRYDSDSVSQSKAERKIESLHERLEKGDNWDELCKVYSDDKNTANKGGELNWMFTGDRLPEEFKEAAYGLDSIGSYSKPVKTRFGWHIVKLLDTKPLGTFDEEKADIEKKIGKDSRSAVKRKAALKKLKEKNGFEIYQTSKNLAFSEIDSSLLKGSWKMDSNSSSFSQELFSLVDSAYSVGSFWEYVLAKQKSRRNTSLSDYLDYLYNQFEETCIFDYEKAQIENTNQEFLQVMDEYESGILLFNLMEKEVWNKAMEDTTGLRGYFEKNKSRYEKEEQVTVEKYTLADTALVNTLLNSLGDSTVDLESLFNSEELLTLQTSNEKVKKGENEFLDSNWKVGNHVESGDNYTIVWTIKSIEPKGNYELSEIRGLVISDYQSELEKAWINSLKKKYPLKVNKQELKKYIARFE